MFNTFKFKAVVASRFCYVIQWCIYFIITIKTSSLLDTLYSESNFKSIISFSKSAFNSTDNTVRRHRRERNRTQRHGRIWKWSSSFIISGTNTDSLPTASRRADTIFGSDTGFNSCARLSTTLLRRLLCLNKSPLQY